MPTIAQMIEGVRAELDFPGLGSPNPRQILKKLGAQIQNVYNDLSNTGHAWDEYELTVNVSPDVADYQLNDTRFGKALLVLTSDDSNPAHFSRPIPVFEIQDLHFNLTLPNDAGLYTFVGYNDSFHTALRVGYYRRGGVPYLRFYPTPQYVCDYDVLFVTGNWFGGAALADEPVLTEHHHLIETRAAISLLPYAKWVDDESVNSEKRQELAVALKNDENIYLGMWNAYKLNMHGAAMNSRWMPEID